MFPLLILAFFFLVPTTSPLLSPPCSHFFFPVSSDRSDTNCKKLATLGAEFGWITTMSHKNTTRVDMYFGAKQPLGWIAWGVNPEHTPEMVGTRAIIGIRYQNGSSRVNTYSITGYTKLGCQLLPSELDLVVTNMSSQYAEDSGYFKIFATVFLNDSVYDVSRLNHVWQVGHGYIGSQPLMHGTRLQNFDSTEIIDLKTGRSVSIGRHRTHMRTVHGILNIVGWGTLLPFGVIIARYTRFYPLRFRLWFRFHIFCQIVGYLLGTIGWAIGLWLGQASQGYYFQIHRILAIFIFTFTTIQMTAIFGLKPLQVDEYRKYWNMYHHFLGYAMLVLIIINIFQGIAILKPNQTWKWAYLGVLALVCSVTVLFEIFTWTKYCCSFKCSSNDPDEG